MILPMVYDADGLGGSRYMILPVRNGTYTSMMLTTMQEHVYNVDWLYAGAGI
jgi:hypothetical protein